MSTAADVAIVTALIEERDAVLRHIPDAQLLEKGESDVHAYYVGSIRTTRSDRATYRIVLTSLGAMGPVKSALRASETVRRFRPRAVLMVGIAGGVSGEVALGDVVVATQVVDYTLGKVEADGRKIRWHSYPADTRLRDSAASMTNAWTARVKVDRPEPGDPKLNFGVVASGGDVIATAARLAEYRKAWPQLVGVEMEGGGVAAALHDEPTRPGFLMTRGISDLADEHKNTEATKRWRKYACDVAGAFAVALLEAGPYPANPTSKGTEADRKKRLIERLLSELSLDELETLIRLGFPEIPDGLSGIVSPVHNFRYRVMHVIAYFERRRMLDVLEAKLDEMLDELRGNA